MNLIMLAYALMAFLVDGIVTYRMIEDCANPDMGEYIVFGLIGMLTGIFWPLCVPYWSVKAVMLLWRRIAKGIVEMRKPPLNASEGRVI